MSNLVTQSLRSTARVIPIRGSRWLLALGFLVLAHAAIIVCDAPLPSTDVFLFKEAGTNLALHGRLATRNLPNQEFDRESVFSYYPPLYPVSFGLWSKTFGLGLRQSLCFDNLVRILRVMLIFALVVLANRTGWAQSDRWAVGMALGLFSFFSTDGDRPDDFAALWGLSAWLILWVGKTRGRYLLVGLLLGFCAGTSPTAACFFTAVVLFLTFLSERGQFRFWAPLSIFILAVGVFLGINLPVYLSDPAAYVRFSAQVPLSTFPYLAPLKAGQNWQACISPFLNMLSQWPVIALPHLTLLAGLSLAFLAVGLRPGPLALERRYQWVGFASLLFVPVCILVWTLQPFYLWFSILGLTVALLGILPSVANPALRRWTWIALLLASLPFCLVQFKNYSMAWERPASDSAASVLDAVTAYLPPEASLAVTPDQYFTFRAQREISNVYYVCGRLKKFDFVYITRHQDLSTLAAQPTPIPCPAAETCFSPVVDLSNHQTYRLAGAVLPYYVRGNGGVLYQNHCTRYPNKPDVN